MAYITKEQTATKRQELKKVIPKNWRLSVRNINYSTLYIGITKADIDIPTLLNKISICTELNPYYIVTQIRSRVEEDSFLDRFDNIIYFNLTEDEKEKLYYIADIFESILRVANEGNYDNSDSQSDYFDVGWCISFEIGGYNKTFELTK